jgi:hypothetical protein
MYRRPHHRPLLQQKADANAQMESTTTVMGVWTVTTLIAQAIGDAHAAMES